MGIICQVYRVGVDLLKINFASIFKVAKLELEDKLVMFDAEIRYVRHPILSRLNGNWTLTRFRLVATDGI